MTEKMIYMLLGWGEQFDPKQHVRFRGMLIAELTRDELLDALDQALHHIWNNDRKRRGVAAMTIMDLFVGVLALAMVVYWIGRKGSPR